MQASTVNAIEVLLAHGTTPTDLANALANANRGQLINAGVGALETASSLLSLFSREVPIFGTLVGTAALTASTGQIAYDLSTTGTVSDNQLQDAMGDLLGLMGTVALAVAALPAAATAVPVLLTIGAIATVAAAAFTLASMDDGNSTEIADQFRDAMADLREVFGDAYDQAIASTVEAIEFSVDSVEGIMQALVDGMGFLSDLYQDMTDGISELVDDFFNSAFNFIQRRDPLILDLDGDGIETSGASSTNPILFDHDGDGIKNGTGWVNSDDGLLVLDRNGNGTIDNGGELFGDSTQLSNGSLAADGFAALADMDSNADGVVNASDTQFANLRVWRDLNQDGISQSGELFTLTDLNIASINVAHTDVTQNLSNGNTITAVGIYTKTDGTTSTVGGTNLGDANLVEDAFHREFTDTIPLAAGVADLPNMQGSGKVRDLWEAANEPLYSLSKVA